MEYIEVLHALTEGKAVCRRSWKGKGVVKSEPVLVYRNGEGLSNVGWSPSDNDILALDWEEGGLTENAGASCGSSEAREADGACLEPAMPDIEGILDEITMSLMDLKIALLKMELSRDPKGCCCEEKRREPK